MVLVVVVVVIVVVLVVVVIVVVVVVIVVVVVFIDFLFIAHDLSLSDTITFLPQLSKSYVYYFGICRRLGLRINRTFTASYIYYLLCYI